MLRQIALGEHMKNKSLAFVASFLIFVHAAAAVPPPAGPNFQVNQVTHLSQNEPDVAQDSTKRITISFGRLIAAAGGALDSTTSTSPLGSV